MTGIIMLLLVLLSVSWALKTAKLSYPKHVSTEEWAHRMRLLADRRKEVDQLTGFEKLTAMEHWLADFDRLSKEQPLDYDQLDMSNIILFSRHKD